MPSYVGVVVFERGAHQGNVAGDIDELDAVIIVVRVVAVGVAEAGSAVDIDTRIVAGRRTVGEPNRATADQGQTVPGVVIELGKVEGDVEEAVNIEALAAVVGEAAVGDRCGSGQIAAVESVLRYSCRVGHC